MCKKPLATGYLQVGQFCCLWNHDRRQLVWKICLHGSFLQRWSMSSLQMMQTVLAARSSSSVASGYLAEERGGRERERVKILSQQG